MIDGAIRIQEKPEVQPCGPSRLREMVPYKVVSIRESFTEAEVGDIVLRFPSNSGAFILNCTRQKMFFDRSTADHSWDQTFKCLRAFHIQSIQFAIDTDDRP